MSASALTSLSPVVRPLSILYADDVLQLRNFMRLLITRAGHRLETFDNGADALDRVRRAPESVDLLITDHNMPRLSGLELVAGVRQLPYAGKIAIFSSSLSQAAADSYRALAVDLILAKPMFPSTLLLMVEQLFQAGHAPAQPETAAPAVERNSR